MSEPVEPSEASAGGYRSDLRRSSTLVATGVGLSRLAGLLRESATAFFLGTGIGADAFRAALRIPNLLQNLLGEGVLSASFIPVYSQALAEGRERDAGRLAGAVAGLLLVITSALVVLGVLFARQLTRVFVPGFTADPDKFELTVTLVRILTPGIGFLVLSAWCLGILNSHRRFFLSYVAPVVWNVAIVAVLAAAALVTTAQVGLARALAAGALVGSVLQFAVQVPSVLRLRPDLRVRPTLAVPGLRRVVRRFGQVVTGRGGVQLAGYLDLVVASLLAAGAVAALGYAQVLYLLPVSLFGMSVAAAELPSLSTMDHADRPGVVRRLDDGLGRVAFFVVPSAVAFIVIGDHVVATVYQGGDFSAAASTQVGLILGAYALGLLASTSSRLLQSSLYGAGDARTPAIYAVLRVTLSLLVGVALMFPLDALAVDADGVRIAGDLGWHVAPESLRSGDDNQLRLGAVGLALGAAIGAWFELALLRKRVQIVFGTVRLAGHHRPGITTAGLVALLAALFARWLVTTIDLHVRLEGLLAMAVTGSGYLIAARVLAVPEARELLAALPGRGSRP